MIRMRLFDKHPTIQKLEQLRMLAEDLGISIHFYGYQTIVKDKDYPDKMFYMDDNELPIRVTTTNVQEFPYPLEYRLTYQKKEDEDTVE